MFIPDALQEVPADFGILINCIPLRQKEPEIKAANYIVVISIYEN